MPIDQMARHYRLAAVALRKASAALDQAGGELLRHRDRQWQRHTEEGMDRIEAALHELDKIVLDPARVA